MLVKLSSSFAVKHLFQQQPHLLAHTGQGYLERRRVGPKQEGRDVCVWRGKENRLKLRQVLEDEAPLDILRTARRASRAWLLR